MGPAGPVGEHFKDVEYAATRLPVYGTLGQVRAGGMGLIIAVRLAPKKMPRQDDARRGRRTTDELGHYGNERQKRISQKP